MNLNLDEKSLLLVGENGSGKSSIINAIEFFFSSKVSPFIGEGTADLNFNDHGHHINFNKEDLNVKVSFKNSEIASRNFKELNCKENNLKSYINQTANSKFILRRRELLDLIESTPSERYSKIIQLIGLNDLNKTENTLKNVKKEFETENKELKSNLCKNFESISKNLNENLKSKEDILKCLNSYLEENNLDKINSLDDLNNKYKELIEKSRKNEDIKLNSLINNLLLEIPNIIANFDELNLNQKLINLNNLISDLLNLHLSQNSNYLSFYESAKEIINNKTDLTSCPLCTQSVDHDALLKLINSNLDSLKVFKNLNNKIKNSINEIKDNLDILNKDLNYLKTNLEKLPDFTNEINEISLNQNQIKNFNTFLLNLHLNNYKLNENIPNFNLEDIDIITKKLESLKNNLEITEKDKNIFELIEKISQIKNNINEIKETELKLKISNNHLNFSNKLLNEFKSTKNKEVQVIFNDIKHDLEEFYNYIHPNEEHNNIELEINEDSKNSVYLKVNSFNKYTENPRAYSSEGHLDTLGLCIFLAFIKRFNQDIPYVLLDDVVTTVDSQHRERIAKLLFKEFGDKQLIITTHDKLWFRQISQMISPYGYSDKFIKCEIKNSKDEISLIGYKNTWETIVEKLEGGDKTCAGNLGRQYLEEVLDSISRNINAELPLQNNGYTVSEYLKAIRSKLKKIHKEIKDNEKKEEIDYALKKLDSSIIGNLLSHNNPISQNISMDEVKTFCLDVNHLKEVFECDNCNRYLHHDAKTQSLLCSKPCKNPSRYYKKQ
ncbi:MAG: AAA family ATPase [Methanobacteriaceae archaeon]|jgi:recombinational DNA repair ATPase RecF|nr:AAA family ATPase [Methanobacteriaceae archaeon]